MKKIIFLILLIFLLTAFIPIARADFSLEIDYPTIGGQQPGTSLTSYIKYIYLFALSIVGIAAFATLVYGGFRYMLSAGNVGSADEAKRIIRGAIFGLILALAAYLILYTINPDLLKLTEPSLPEVQTYQGLQTGGTSVHQNLTCIYTDLGNKNSCQDYLGSQWFGYNTSVWVNKWCSGASIQTGWACCCRQKTNP